MTIIKNRPPNNTTRISLSHCFRLWHPNQKEARKESLENPFREPPFPTAVFLDNLTFVEGKYYLRLDESEPDAGSLYASTQENPQLSLAWSKKGWNLEYWGHSIKRLS